MKQMFSNATVAWSEREIAKRESLIREIPAILCETWGGMNRALRFERVETPVLVNEAVVRSHIEAKFPLLHCDRGYLRPETTAGLYEAITQKFPQEPQLKKALPYCFWQVGLSFRNEDKPETMRASRLRLVQFYQMEFVLFCASDTKADYLTPALEALVRAFGGVVRPADELPHYSKMTLDWYLGDLEVAGNSVRTDWPFGSAIEVSIGLDRLVAKLIDSTT